MDISSLLQSSMGQQLISGATDQLGIENQKAKQAIEMTVPFLLKAMDKNISTPEGASGLSTALDKDHDGSILDNLSDFLQQGDFSEGQGILKHILGNKQTNVQNAIGQSTGIDMGSAGDLLAMAAPIVMGYLGKEKRSQQVNQDGIGKLINSLLGNQNNIQNNQNELSMIEKLLDQDGDGSISDDVINLGGKLLGSFFKK